MAYATGVADDFAGFDSPLRSGRKVSTTRLAVMAVLFSLSASALTVYGPSVFAPRAGQSIVTVALPVTPAPAFSALLDPKLANGMHVALVEGTRLKPGFEVPAPPPPAPLDLSHDIAPVPVEASAPAAAVEAPLPVEVPAAAAPAMATVAGPVPLPTPRPVASRDVANREAANREAAAQGPGRASVRPPAPRGGGTTVVAGTPPDGRSFIEKLFGLPRASGAALAYASPGDDDFGRPRPMTAAPTFGYDRSTAVYDIAAHTVYMPDGQRLEAHSGLGAMLDDPRYVHLSMRGATPPHVYDLRPREQLFHGVPALRLTPIGGGNVFGRTGLLAHTYMLGPKGDSNGCVSFKNYDAFLQAYRRGEIKRLVVVPRQT